MCIQEIAAIVGPDDGTVPLSEPGTVVVYRRVRGNWEKDREMAFGIEPARGLRDLRNRVEELKRLLRDCRVFVAKSASGALFFELEKARFSVWEIAGTPAEFLDSVWRDEKAEQTAACLPPDAGIPSPTETSPGHFTISIKEIQGKRPEVSSKQVLQDFVRKGAFEQLEVTCDHLPPWIEVDATRCGYEIGTEQIGKNEIKVRLTKNARGGCC
jgi:Fe-only nitrogenase accessory protein AnfO